MKSRWFLWFAVLAVVSTVTAEPAHAFGRRKKKPKPTPTPSYTPTPTPTPTPTFTPSPTPTPSPTSGASLVRGNPCSSDGSTVYYSSLSSSCQINVQGVARTFLLHVPASYRPGSGSLIVAIHGYGASESGATFEGQTRLSAHSDGNGFAVAYLDSISLSPNWNVSQDPTRPDDVAYTRAVATQLIQMLRLDPRRLYVTGFSGGAFFVHTVATQLSDLFAAAASLSGRLPLPLGTVDPDSYSRPLNPVAMLMINGDADTSVSYCGGVSTHSSGLTVYATSADENFDHWFMANGCTSVTSSVPLCVGTPATKGTPNTSQIDHKKATGCRAGADVETVALRAGGHAWYDTMHATQPPGVNNPYNSTFPPLGSPAIGDNELVWNFFKAHPKP